MAADLVHLNGLKLDVRIGFHAGEQHMIQSLRADVAIETDFREGPQNDDRKGLVDYFELERRLRERVDGRSYDLIEALAVDLARQVISAYPRVRVRVRVTKFPLQMPGLESVSAECVREKSDFEP